MYRLRYFQYILRLFTRRLYSKGSVITGGRANYINPSFISDPLLLAIISAPGDFKNVCGDSGTVFEKNCVLHSTSHEPQSFKRLTSCLRPESGLLRRGRTKRIHVIIHQGRSRPWKLEAIVNQAHRWFAMGPGDVDYSLYLVTDSTSAILGDRDLVEVVEAALNGGVTICQYRDKVSDTVRDFSSFVSRSWNVLCNIFVSLRFLE